MTPAGFPHSDIHGSVPAFGFPWLFVDRYVLLRLPVPRHPPCALLSLTFRYDRLDLSFTIMLESLILGFSLAIPSHLAVQCVTVFVCLFKKQSLVSWLHILSFLLYSVFKVPLWLRPFHFSAVLRRNASAPAVVGSSGLEPPTSRLSGVRSNHLSYEPMLFSLPEVSSLVPLPL